MAGLALCKKIYNLEKKVDLLTEKTGTLARQRDALKSALEAVEWSGDYQECPACGRRYSPDDQSVLEEFRGHNPDCQLVAALRLCEEVDYVDKSH